MIEPNPPSRLAALGPHSVHVRWLEGREGRIRILTNGRTQHAAPLGRRAGAARRHRRAAQQRPRDNRAEPSHPSRPLPRDRSPERKPNRACASPSGRPTTARAGDPSPLPGRTRHRPDRRTFRALAPHRPNTRQKRAPPPQRQLATRGARPSRDYRRRPGHLIDVTGEYD